MTRKINVLQFICPTGFYGAERWILALANHLSSQEIRCDLAVTKEPESQELEVVKQFSTSEGAAFEIPMSHRFDLGVIGRLCELIKKRNIDIIHTHGYKSDILGLIAAKKTGITCISTPHGFENADDWKLRLYIKLGCLSLKYFDMVVPLSKQLCDDIDKLGIPPDKVTYIQNGVDLDEVDQIRNSQASSHLDTKEKRIGFVGQMISRKNIVDILDIFEKLSMKYTNLRLILLGDGEERASLEKHAQTLSSSNKIEFLGFRQDRLELLKSFDIFVMTSTLEGIPRCLMETMAMGIPVAAYDIPGIDQLIQHEKTGLMAPLGDKQTLSDYWEKILFNPNFSNSISENAREYVLTHFSAQRMAKEYAQLFHDMVSK
jgi:glycosyltransferase involved in cell wall biosynthesis